MKYVLLGIFFLNGCFFNPVQELHDQIEETYFGNDFVEEPTPLSEGLKSDTKLNLEMVWQRDIGEHNGSNLDIFHFEESLFVATSDGTIKKFNIDGEELWENKIDYKITSGIAGDDENIYLSTSDGFLWCLDHKGELVWKTLLSGEINSLPIIYDSKIVVKINSYKIIQLNAKDGSVIWKYQAAIPPLTFKSEGKLVQANNVVYLGLPGGKLIAIDSPTGGLVWESNISRSKGTTDIDRANDITSHPIIDGSVIYGVTTNGDISALDRRNGKTIWTKPLSSFYGMSFDGFNLFVTHDTGSIYSVNKEDGEVNWRQGAFQYRRIRKGTLIKDYIVFGDYFGYVHFLSINDGSIIGRIKFEESQILNNINKIGDSLIVFTNTTGNLICLKVGEEVLNQNKVIDDSLNNELKTDKKMLKKHKVFEREILNSEDFQEAEEEVINSTEDKQTSQNKKHRVFKNKDKKGKEEKGVLDKLLDKIF